MRHCCERRRLVRVRCSRRSLGEIETNEKYTAVVICWSEPVVRLFRRMNDKVRNKLTKRHCEHEVSWSTSTWLALQAQRFSVALHIASAWEIATEMQLAGGGGEAPSSDEEGAATA